MTRSKAKTGRKRLRVAPSVGRGGRKPVDLDVVRQQISDLVGSHAVNLVEVAMAEAEKGQYAAMKYLFELIGLYPAGEQEAPAESDSLTKALLQRMGFPEEKSGEEAITKDCAAGDVGNRVQSDAVE